jgi:hypothetical protein
MDTALLRRFGEAAETEEPSLYPTASERRCGGVKTTTEGKEGSN